MRRKKIPIEDICIVDFSGYFEPGHFPTSYWADWNGVEVIFGGEWKGVSNMPSRKEPSEEEVHKWVATHPIKRPIIQLEV